MQDTYKAIHSTALLEYTIDSHFLWHLKMTSQLIV